MWLTSVIGLSSVGSLLSCFMWRRSSAGSSLPGCGGNSGCDEVIRSRWSNWFGLPVAAPATAIYLSLTIASILSISRAGVSKHWALGLLLALSAVIGAAAVWFIWLQWWMIRRFCAYCTILHVIGLAICGLVVGKLVLDPADRLSSQAIKAALGTSAISVVLFIAGQVLVKPKMYAIGLAPTPPPEAIPIQPALQAASPKQHRQLVVLNGVVSLDVGVWPCLGSPDAKHLVVCLFDYTCPTCRKTHGFLSDAVDRFGGHIAFLLLPVPMDPTCNRHLSQRNHLHAHACRFARLALLVWQAKPERYAEFDHWMFEEAEPPPIGMAISKVRELLGSDDVDPARPDSALDSPIFQAIEWYRKLDTQRIPTLLFSGASLKGELPSAEELFRILEREYPDLRPAARSVAPV